MEASATALILWDYHGEAADGNQLPSLNVFLRRNARYTTSIIPNLLFAPNKPGMAARHVDLIWPLWNLLDFTLKAGERIGIRS
jgi:hypothetical protein